MENKEIYKKAHTNSIMISLTSLFISLKEGM
jgi:hypothetical protein